MWADPCHAARRRNDTRHRTRANRSGCLSVDVDPIAQRGGHGSGVRRCSSSLSSKTDQLGGATVARLADEPPEISVFADVAKAASAASASRSRFMANSRNSCSAEGALRPSRQSEICAVMGKIIPCPHRGRGPMRRAVRR